MPYGIPFSAALCRFAQVPRKSLPRGPRFAGTTNRPRGQPSSKQRTPQLERLGRNSRRRPRAPDSARRPDPMPYGIPFSAALCRFAQVPRKSLPRGPRFAGTTNRPRGQPSSKQRTPQLERLGRNSRRRPRAPDSARRPDPMPYGIPFSAALCRSAQVPRKSLPRGPRFATVVCPRRNSDSQRPVPTDSPR